MRSIGLTAILLILASYNASAADLNGYTAEYECRAGGQYCDVDVDTLTSAACDVTVTTSDSDWTKITGDSGQTVYCIEKGNHSYKGKLTISHSGTSGTRKILKYYASSDSDDDPWDQSTSNQAIVYSLGLKSDYWIIHRLTINPSYDKQTAIKIADGVPASNTILNRILIEKNQGWLISVGAGAAANKTTVQNSVIRDTTVLGGPNDRPCATVGYGSADVHYVNNEIYNCSDKILASNWSSAKGLVIENNDLYITEGWYTDGNGNLDPNGDRACSENAIDLKGGGTSSQIVRIIHNRMWGERSFDGNCTDGAAGEEIVLHDGGSGSNYHLVQNNIIFDAQNGIHFPNPTSYNNSVIGNILWRIKSYNNTRTSSATSLSHKTANTEWYLNSFIDNEYWAALGGTTNGDFRCNALIASGSFTGSDSSLGAGTQIDTNVWYDSVSTGYNNIEQSTMIRSSSASYSLGDIIRTADTSMCTTTDDSDCFLYQVIVEGKSDTATVPYCTSLGCIADDGEISVQAIRGPLAFYRKLHTGPELMIIPYVRAHNTVPETNGCPSNYADRQSIGVNNSQ